MKLLLCLFAAYGLYTLGKKILVWILMVVRSMMTYQGENYDEEEKKRGA